MVAGNLADIAWGRQTAKGTPLATPTHRAYLAGGALSTVREVQDLAETSGTRLRAESYPSIVRAEGSPEIFARVDAFTSLVRAALGAISTTGAADPYEHTIVPADALPYYTFYRMLGGTALALYERFVDCKISQLVITSDAGAPVRLAVTVVGLDPRSKTTHSWSAVAIDEEKPLYHYNGEGAFLVEGAAVSEIDHIALTINNNNVVLQGDALHGFAVSEALLDITAEIGHVVLDKDLYNRFHYGSATPADDAQAGPSILELTGGIDLTWTNPDVAGRTAQVVATRLQLQSLGGFEPNTDGSPLRQTATYKVYQPAADDGITFVMNTGRPGTDY